MVVGVRCQELLWRRFGLKKRLDHPRHHLHEQKGFLEAPFFGFPQGALRAAAAAAASVGE